MSSSGPTTNRPNASPAAADGVCCRLAVAAISCDGRRASLARGGVFPLLALAPTGLRTASYRRADFAACYITASGARAIFPWWAVLAGYWHALGPHGADDGIVVLECGQYRPRRLSSLLGQQPPASIHPPRHVQVDHSRIGSDRATGSLSTASDPVRLDRWPSPPSSEDGRSCRHHRCGEVMGSCSTAGAPTPRQLRSRRDRIRVGSRSLAAGCQRLRQCERRVDAFLGPTFGRWLREDFSEPCLLDVRANSGWIDAAGPDAPAALA